MNYRCRVWLFHLVIGFLFFTYHADSFAQGGTSIGIRVLGDTKRESEMLTQLVTGLQAIERISNIDKIESSSTDAARSIAGTLKIEIRLKKVSEGNSIALSYTISDITSPVRMSLPLAQNLIFRNNDAMSTELARLMPLNGVLVKHDLTIIESEDSLASWCDDFIALIETEVLPMTEKTDREWKEFLVKYHTR